MAHRYYCGVDLGQAADYTTVSVIEQMAAVVTPLQQVARTFSRRFSSADSEREPLPVDADDAEQDEPDEDGNKPQMVYALRHLERIPLGTTYPAVVAHVLTLLDRKPLSRAETPLVVDRTGVGNAVVDMFALAGKRPYAISITGGSAITRKDEYTLNVPKRELVGDLVALFHQQRLRINRNLEAASDLVNELTNFRMKINVATGHESFEAWRESIHDDLVLSVAIVCWYAEHRREWGGGPVGVWFI